MTMDPVQWFLSNVEKLSLLTVAGGIILSFFKGWIVTGREYKKIIADCDYHRNAHERLQEKLERTLEITSTMASISKNVVERPPTTRTRSADQE
jgi:hypothetical protein